MGMKDIRSDAMSGMKSKLSRFGGKMGEKKHLEKGGKCYAAGGATGAANSPASDIGGKSMPGSNSKPAKKKGKGKGKGHGDTHVNVVVMPKDGGPGGMPMPPPGPPPAMPPPPPMPPKPPMAGPPGMPPGGPGMPPGGPMPGGPPMMPHKAGGRVSRKEGGPVRGVKDGAGGAKGRMEKMKKYGSSAGKAVGMTK